MLLPKRLGDYVGKKVISINENHKEELAKKQLYLEIFQNHPIEMYDYIKMTKPLHLTLGDVRELKVGDKIDVICWDRNWEEYWIWDNAEKDKPYDPREFFKGSKQILEYKGGCTWDINFSFGEMIVHPFHVSLDTKDSV